ncbi:MAG TPA: di-trans,poly-cis-decaprenylcistransferase [Bryobacteraceae bacterium]|nr:di-trans,poly-cis-decaprenylcistransferase [Bryobacteraceae bacterium]
MSQYFTLQSNLRVAIIMDGNGRWATARGLPRVAGHQAGADTLRRIVEAAPECGIESLTVYAFSSDNWKRPTFEIEALMALFAAYLESEVPRCIANGVRMTIIGRRDRLPGSLVDSIATAERETRRGSRLHLRIALDYSARDAILNASRQAAGEWITRERFGELLGEGQSIDILIRTGGEQRLSDFLLWECAYAELVFTNRMWPDFSPLDLERTIHEFARRERRFGAVPQAPEVIHDRWLR